MHIPPGITIDLARHLKTKVNIPIMAGYQIDSPQMANAVIAEGKADLTGFVRRLICDPDFAKKAKEGKAEDIRSCLRDNQGCIGRINQSKVLGCTLNSRVGRELSSGSYKPTPGKKNILIVGGGPAGMEAARVARKRGHEVTLYEQNNELGGQINLIKIRPGRQRMAGVIHYFEYSLAQLGVQVITNTKVDRELVLAKDIDAVVVATGSKPRIKPFPGEYESPAVLNVWDVLHGRHTLGERILYIDEHSGHHATATVEYLADQGKKVEMLTSHLFVGTRLAPLGDLYLTRQRLLKKGVIFIAEVQVEAINQNKVQARNVYTNQPVIFEGYDTIVLDVGNVVEDDLYRQLKGKVNQLHRIGDSMAPRDIETAIWEGRATGEIL